MALPNFSAIKHFTRIAWLFLWQRVDHQGTIRNKCKCMAQSSLAPTSTPQPPRGGGGEPQCAAKAHVVSWSFCNVAHRLLLPSFVSSCSKMPDVSGVVVVGSCAPPGSPKEQPRGIPSKNATDCSQPAHPKGRVLRSRINGSMKGFQHGKAEGQARRCSDDPIVDPKVEDALMDVSRGPTADHLAYTMLKVRSIKGSIVVLDTAFANKLQGCNSFGRRLWWIEMRVIQFVCCESSCVHPKLLNRIPFFQDLVWHQPPPSDLQHYAVLKHRWRDTHSCVARKQFCPLILNDIVFRQTVIMPSNSGFESTSWLLQLLPSEPNLHHNAKGRNRKLQINYKLSPKG